MTALLNEGLHFSMELTDPTSPSTRHLLRFMSHLDHMKFIKSHVTRVRVTLACLGSCSASCDDVFEENYSDNLATAEYETVVNSFIKFSIFLRDFWND